MLESPRLSRELGLARTILINDFAAVGYGILGLQDSDCLTLQAGKPAANAPIAVIGAGTGLGQGFLVHHVDGYRVYSSEGGHADFSPRSEQECELLLYLRDKRHISRISVERVVSGQGIVAINRKASSDGGQIVQPRQVGQHWIMLNIQIPLNRSQFT